MSERTTAAGFAARRVFLSAEANVLRHASFRTGSQTRPVNNCDKDVSLVCRLAVDSKSILAGRGLSVLAMTASETQQNDLVVKLPFQCFNNLDIQPKLSVNLSVGSLVCNTFVFCVLQT